ncbi:MAG: TolC family protein [Verrucomicrobia bacterium]|nr:TolC family protein [Verrucomicrobiota bacterium]MCH8513443.1 TolC family protein [Kiritimatiellia bacterium]
MRFFICFFWMYIGVFPPVFAESTPDFDSFLNQVIGAHPDVSRQVLLLRAAEEAVQASGSSRATELEIRGGSGRFSSDSATDVIEVELSRPVPGSNRVAVGQSLATIGQKRQQLELEQLVRDLSLEIRTELLTLWRLKRVTLSLEESREEWQGILRMGEEMVRNGHMTPLDIQPYRMSLLQVQRDLREMTREKERSERALGQWAEDVSPPDPEEVFILPEHECAAFERLPPIRESQLALALAEVDLRAAVFAGREEPRLGLFVEHEREENGGSGHMMGVFFSVSLPYRAETHQRKSMELQRDAARERLRMREREWRVELSALREETESVRETLKWFDTELLPQALEGVDQLNRAVEEGRMTPLEHALAQVEVQMLQRERLEYLHRLSLLQARTHRWCGPDPVLFLSGDVSHD